MMSPSAIADLAREQAVKAAAYEIEPYVPASIDECLNWNHVPIPNIGSFRPQGWCLVEHKLVDKSGLGRDDEPALTIPAFKRWAASKVAETEYTKWSAGFAIIEEGQFQVVIGLFTNNPEKFGDCTDEHEDIEWEGCPECDEPIETKDGKLPDSCPWCDEDLRPRLFEEGDQVDVPAPEYHDLWQHEFTGTVTEYDPDTKEVTVEDQDGETWDIDAGRVKKTYNPDDDPAQLRLI